MVDKTRVLFIAADPVDVDSSKLNEEIQEVEQHIRTPGFLEAFDLTSKWALRSQDLIQAFQDVRPDIVHISGHRCRMSEFVLEDARGIAKPVSESALTELFSHAKDNARLVLLNMCHSGHLAKAISNVIDCAIGINQRIDDKEAVVFSSQFYGALALGQSVRNSFEQGRTALMVDGIPEETTPMLFIRPGADALQISFSNHKSN